MWVWVCACIEVLARPRTTIAERLTKRAPLVSVGAKVRANLRLRLCVSKTAFVSSALCTVRCTYMHTYIRRWLVDCWWSPRMYQRDALRGGHVIMLGGGCEEAALAAIRCDLPPPAHDTTARTAHHSRSSGRPKTSVVMCFCVRPVLRERGIAECFSHTTRHYHHTTTVPRVRPRRVYSAVSLRYFEPEAGVSQLTYISGNVHMQRSIFGGLVSPSLYIGNLPRMQHVLDQY